MKRFFLLLLVLSLSIVPAFALTGPGISPGSTVISGSPEDLDKTVVILEEDETFTTALLPFGDLFAYVDSSGRGQLLPVQWDLSDTALSRPGLHEITAAPLLPEGMTLAEDYDGLVSWPIFRKGEGAVLPLASISAPSLGSRLLSPTDDPAVSLQPGIQVRNCRTAEHWLIDVRQDADFFWQWDLSSIDPSTFGAQTIRAELHHPDWIAVPDSLRFFSETVYVMPTDRIELCAPTSVSADGTLTFQWLYGCSNVTDAVLEQKTGSQWISCPDDVYIYHINTLQDTHLLLLDLTKLPAETPVVLRLRYRDVVDGKAVERVTEPITLTIPADLPDRLANGIQMPVDVLSGDRDGSDAGGTKLPDFSQSAGSHSSAPVFNPVRERPEILETVTETYTEISGRRLAQLAAMADTVLFEHRGVAAEIPSALLQRLSLEEDELLRVEIHRPESHTVQLYVTADGKTVQDLSGTVLRLPWQDSTVVEVLDQDGTAAEASVDSHAQILTIAIDRAGTYELLPVSPPLPEVSVTVPATADTPIPEEESDPPLNETPDAHTEPDREKITNIPSRDVTEDLPVNIPAPIPAEKPQKNTAPLWVLLPVCVLLAVGVTLWIRRRHHE